jgi:hypothetical protein
MEIFLMAIQGPTNTPNTRIDAFQENVTQVAQQIASKALAFVDKDSEQAETNAWDFLGTGEMHIKPRDTASTGLETGRQWSRRQAVAIPYVDFEIIETQDPTQMMYDPNSKIITSMGMAAGRAYDDIIFAAGIGDANVITRSGAVPTTTPTALDAGQILGDGTAPISFDLVAQVVRLFGFNEIDPSIFKVAFIGPHQVYELLNLTEQTSSDYVNREALQTLSKSGVCPNWMGMDWVMSTRLPVETDDMRSLIFMTDVAVGMHCPQDITTYFERDPSQQYAWRPQTEFTAGAVRLEDAQLVKMIVAETGTTAPV